jgi:hypothetical protein
MSYAQWRSAGCRGACMVCIQPPLRFSPVPIDMWSEVVIFNLQVMFHNGMSNNDKDFEMCFKVDNVVLPKTGYFGISAATGGLAGKLPLTLNTLK